MNCKEELINHGLSEEQYNKIIFDIDAKLNGDLDIDWVELVEKYNLSVHPDTLRKASASIFGGKFRAEYAAQNNQNEDFDNKLSAIRKERIKLQTANIERNRIDRKEARKEMFYEYVGSVCNTLPSPDFQPLYKKTGNVEYLLTLSDIHFGACFKSENNEYSPAIAKERFNLLLGYVKDFVETHKVNTLRILGLGDNIQGILRISDLKLNESSIVKATVEVSKLIASFINEVSTYCNVKYYHVPFANHTQLRNLGSKVNELPEEDLEYIIGHYIETLCSRNDRVEVVLADEGEQYLEFTLHGFTIITGHGHTLKGYKNSLKDLTLLRGNFYDYCILGHYHGGDMMTACEGYGNDCEVIVAPSFVGSDPYSDSLMTGSKAACLMLGFVPNYGHTETYKFILN